MGTDHGIIVAWGYRIPLKVWNEFRKGIHNKCKQEQRSYWKKRKTEPDYDREDEGSYDSLDSDQMDTETEFDKIRYPDRDANYRIESQGLTTDDGYIFIYDPVIDRETAGEDGFVNLMYRKIGGALAWTCSGFEHMQNINSLNFSVKLVDDDCVRDWKLEDGTWSEDTQKRKDFLNGLPEPLREFLSQFPTEKYYNRWLFSYAS